MSRKIIDATIITPEEAKIIEAMTPDEFARFYEQKIAEDALAAKDFARLARNAPKEPKPAKLPKPKKLRRGRQSLYFLHKLEIGDNIDVPAKNAMNLKSSAAGYKKRNPGWAYRSQVLPDGGMRIIRVS